MIAARFRSVGWVLAGTVAMLSCYLVTQGVAGERAELVRVERKLLAAKRDVRRLQTEIETRSRMAQIERWNVEVLALTAARPEQYVNAETQLASFTRPPAPVPAPVQAVSAPAGVAQASYEAPAAPVAAVAPSAAPMLRPATYIKPKDEIAAKVQRIALLDDDIAAEIGGIAKARTSRKNIDQ